MKRAAVLGLTLLASACATGPRWANGEPPVLVTAAMETVVKTDPTVDADDPALWADPSDPSRAVMFGTDKTDGLYVHNLDGSVRQFFPSGALNNVDLRPGFKVDGKDYVLVGASADEAFGLFVYLFDPATLETKQWGFISTGTWEPYGFCMAKRDGNFYLIADSKNGEAKVWTVAAGPSGPVAELIRTVKVGSQPEGCVVDEEAGNLYIGEEDVGLWRVAFGPGASDELHSIARIDGKRLTADVEGVTIMRDKGKKYLIASSQGDDTYNVFRIEGPAHVYIGRFAIVAGETIDAVTATDGLDAFSGPIGQFPEGAIAFHDDEDTPSPGQQNYKVVDWRDIRKALNLN
ncbi:MAG TPA: phytase [Hyphomonadaceae bacterium]|nr:phytase [Hyphomonadaceae bacterium]HPI46939.1 phytase [Hyphomonadaceae bacterium]